jgi:hypothetical protein
MVAGTISHLLARQAHQRQQGAEEDAAQRGDHRQRETEIQALSTKF